MRPETVKPHFAMVMKISLGDPVLADPDGQMLLIGICEDGKFLDPPSARLHTQRICLQYACIRDE